MEEAVQVWLCHNSQTFLEKYKSFLLEVAQGLQLDLRVSIYSSGEQLLFHLEDRANFPDLIYVQLDMSRMKGLDTALHIRNQGIISELIFWGQNKDLLFDCFEVDLLDYLLLEEEEFDFKEHFACFSKSIAQIKQSRDKMITFNSFSGNKTYLDNILYFQINHRIVTAVCHKGEMIDFYSSMNELEKELEPKKFIRVHRSFLVNFKYISKFDQKNVHLTNGEIIPTGLYYKNRIKQIFYTESPQLMNLE